MFVPLIVSMLIAVLNLSSHVTKGQSSPRNKSVKRNTLFCGHKVKHIVAFRKMYSKIQLRFCFVFFYSAVAELLMKQIQDSTANLESERKERYVYLFCVNLSVKFQNEIKELYLLNLLVPGLVPRKVLCLGKALCHKARVFCVCLKSTSVTQKISKP